MPLLQKLFNSDRRRRQWCSRKEPNLLSPEKLTSYKWWPTPEFDSNQIRLIVFTDNDTARKLRFDSKTVKKIDPGQCKSSPSGSCARSRVRGLLSPSDSPPPSGGTTANGCQYVRGRPSADEDLLGEMLFGSVAMSYKGSMTKVHTIKSPPQLMLSRVFQLTKTEESVQDEKDCISLYGGDGSIPQNIRSLYQNESESIAHSIPVAIPANSPYHSQDEDSSDFSASGSFVGPIPSPGSLSSGTTTPNNSLHRRWWRNQVTSMEYVARKKSCDMTNSEEPIARKRKPKIGVSIVISLPENKRQISEQFKTFFFSHFSMFEHHFLRLCSQVENILVHHRKTLLRSSLEVLDSFRATITSIYFAPRIQQPIWLNMMTHPQQRSNLCQQLVRLLVYELVAHNNKQTNFFVSRLLTAVLTHHLAWVPTVMPSGSTPSRAYLDKHSSSMLDSLAQSHPYNPLWAQLGDLYGAIGYPHKIARTVVVGKQADVVCRLLYILSYFIRCSEVHEKEQHCNEFTVHFDPEGHVFTWSLSVEENNTDLMGDFEKSGTVSEQSSAAHTDSGFAEGHDGLSRDNISLFQSEELSEADFMCKNEELLKQAVGERDSGFVRGAVPHPGDIKTELQRLQECQSLCSSVTVLSDDSTASTVCEERGREERQRTPVPVEGQKATGTDILLEGQQPLVRTVDDFGDAYCREGEIRDNAVTKVGDDRMSEICQVEKSNPGVGGRDEIGITVCRITDNVQYVSKVEVDVPVGRAETHHLHDRESGIDRQGRCTSCGLANEKGISAKSPTSASERNFNQLVRTLCHSCLSDSDASIERPHKEDTHLPPATSNSSKGNKIVRDREPCRSRHQSGQNDAEEGRGLLRGISSVSEGSLTSSTITFHSESTVFDQEELPLAIQHSRDGDGCRYQEERGRDDSYINNIGRSLLGGYTQKYVPDLALHGTLSLDLQQVGADLVSSVEHSVLDEPTAEAVCIVANTDKWTVDLVSSDRSHGNVEKYLGQQVATSHMVQTLLESVQSLAQETGRKLEPDFCLMHLEDRLQEIYFSSTVLASYLENNPGATTKELSLNLGFSVSDFQLLLSVTSVHSPHVIMSVLKESYEKLRSSPERTPPSSLKEAQ